MWDLFRNVTVSVGKPWWLLLIPALIPALIAFSYRSLAGLGRVRRLLAIGLRSLIVTLIVLALAEIQSVRTNDRLTTIFLLDMSQSIPREWQRAMRDYVNRQVEIHKKNGDLAGVIV